MSDVLGKLSSRKFLLAIAAYSAALIGLLTQAISFLEFLGAVVASLLAYEIGEGLADNGGARPDVEIKVAPPGRGE